MSDYVHGRRDFTWREHPDGWALYCVGRADAVLHVVPDATYPNMWRIRHPDGRLSDMANLTRARDGGVAVAMRAINPRKGTQEQAAISPPISESDPAATTPPDSAPALLEAAA